MAGAPRASHGATSRRLQYLQPRPVRAASQGWCVCASGLPRPCSRRRLLRPPAPLTTFALPPSVMHSPCQSKISSAVTVGGDETGMASCLRGLRRSPTPPPRLQQSPMSPLTSIQLLVQRSSWPLHLSPAPSERAAQQPSLCLPRPVAWARRAVQGASTCRFLLPQPRPRRAVSRGRFICAGGRPRPDPAGRMLRPLACLMPASSIFPRSPMLQVLTSPLHSRGRHGPLPFPSCPQ